MSREKKKSKREKAAERFNSGKPSKYAEKNPTPKKEEVKQENVTTIINIGLGRERKNIVNIHINKPFKEIEYSDIKEIVLRELGTLDGIEVQGWANVTPE